MLVRTAEIGQERPKTSAGDKGFMEYQLVFQFKGDDVLNFDSLVGLEEQLQELLKPIADVDGHDMGTGEANIFVLTADPGGTFEQAKSLLAEASLLNKVHVAFRDVRSDIFTVVWPEHSTEVFVVA